MDKFGCPRNFFANILRTIWDSKGVAPIPQSKSFQFRSRRRPIMLNIKLLQLPSMCSYLKKKSSKIRIFCYIFETITDRKLDKKAWRIILPRKRLCPEATFERVSILNGSKEAVLLNFFLENSVSWARCEKMGNSSCFITSNTISDFKCDNDGLICCS